MIDIKRIDMGFDTKIKLVTRQMLIKSLDGRIFFCENLANFSSIRVIHHAMKSLTNEARFKLDQVYSLGVKKSIITITSVHDFLKFLAHFHSFQITHNNSTVCKVNAMQHGPSGLVQSFQLIHPVV